MLFKIKVNNLFFSFLKFINIYIANKYQVNFNKEEYGKFWRIHKKFKKRKLFLRLPNKKFNICKAANAKQTNLEF